MHFLTSFVALMSVIPMYAAQKEYIQKRQQNLGFRSIALPSGNIKQLGQELARAIKRNNEEEVRRILESDGSELVNIRYFRGNMTPLMYAISFSVEEALKQVRATLRTADEETRISLEHEIGRLEQRKADLNAIVDLLLAAGPRLEMQDEIGETVLHKAVYYQNLDALKKLIRYAEKHRLNIFDIQNNVGNTALMLAAKNDFILPLELLLEAKVDTNKQDVDGYTALMFAAETGDTPVAEILIKAGADTTIKNAKDMGKTALDYANEKYMKIAQQVENTLDYKKAEKLVKQAEDLTKIMKLTEEARTPRKVETPSSMTSRPGAWKSPSALRREKEAAERAAAGRASSETPASPISSSISPFDLSQISRATSSPSSTSPQ